MSYKVVEDGFLTLIRLLSNYNQENSSIGDYRILGRGVVRAVVLMPGGIPRREVLAAPRYVHTLWVINVELYIPFLTDISDIHEAMRVDRQELIDHIDKYPTLNKVADVVNAFITGATEPEEWIGESRRWWRQVLRCEVSENVTVTIAE